MKPYESVLFYPGDETRPSRALHRALSLAGASGSTLTVFEVMPELPRAVRDARLSVDEKEDALEVLRSHRRAQLEAMVAEANSDGVPTVVDVAFGTPSVEITRRVMAAGHDIVIKTALGDGSGGSRGISSTGLHLLRECPCPVWVLRREDRDSPPRILAAVDPSESAEEARGLARRVISEAVRVADAEGGTLHVAHAWWFWAEDTLRGPRFKMAEAKLAEMVRSVKDDAARSLQDLLDDFDMRTDDANVHLVRGKAADALVSLAESLDIDLLVMGTVSRTGVKGLLIGNTAEQVLRLVSCSILAIKPEDFRSPLA